MSNLSDCTCGTGMDVGIDRCPFHRTQYLAFSTPHPVIHHDKCQTKYESLQAKCDDYEKALQPLKRIADAYDDNGLDECRPDWGDAPDDFELYHGRGGRNLLTLGHARVAREVLAKHKARE